MKHIVNVTISNPSHEFVSMRNRQSTTNYMVEAKNEAEAILRASRHFKSLGHYVHNAVIAESTLNEEVDHMPVAPVPGDKWKSHAIMVHPKTKQRIVVARKNVGNYPKSDGWKEVGPGMRLKKEEVEQIDEVGDTAKGKEVLSNYIDKANRKSSNLNRKVTVAKSSRGRNRSDAKIANASDAYNKNLDNIDRARDRLYNREKVYKEEVVNEKAPPGAKYERMVKHIKNQYSKDGTLTPKEKAIAYATAWKAKNSGK